MAYGMGSHRMYGSGDRVDGGRVDDLALRPGLPGRLWPRGAGAGTVNFELGVDAQRRESPMHGGASNEFMGRADERAD